MNEALTFTRKPGISWFHFRYAFVVLLPVVFFIGSIYFYFDQGWKTFFAIFPFAIVSLPFAIYIHLENKRLSKSKIELDPYAESIVFHHFRFTSKFFPEAPRQKENLHFSDIVSSRFYGTQYEDSIHLETTKGKVVITEEMSDFRNIVEIFASLSETNQSNEREFAEKSKLTPKIQTPWYGWLILASAVACAAIAGWYFMYRTN